MSIGGLSVILHFKPFGGNLMLAVVQARAFEEYADLTKSSNPSKGARSGWRTRTRRWSAKNAARSSCSPLESSSFTLTTASRMSPPDALSAGVLAERAAGVARCTRWSARPAERRPWSPSFPAVTGRYTVVNALQRRRRQIAGKVGERTARLRHSDQKSQTPGSARGFPMLAARAGSSYAGPCSAQSCTRLTTTFTASFIH